MTSVPLAAPIRQPRGPPSDTSASQPAFALSPPTADADSLRRANTVSTPRHQPSASVSSTLATTSAFHGQAKGQQPNNNGRFKVIGRFRSGSLSSGDAGVNLVRKGSGREAVRPEQAVVEDEDPEEEQQAGTESFGKGLSRQSSLPSRRCKHTYRHRYTDQQSGMLQLYRPLRTRLWAPWVRLHVHPDASRLIPPLPNRCHLLLSRLTSLRTRFRRCTCSAHPLNEYL